MDQKITEILNDLKKGKIDESEAKEKLKELGIDMDNVQSKENERSYGDGGNKDFWSSLGTAFSKLGDGIEDAFHEVRDSWNENYLIDGDIEGDYHGDLRGRVNGDLKGSLLGNLFGSVQGDIAGNVEGDIFGVVKGDVKGDIRGSVMGKVGGNIGGDVQSVMGVVAGNIQGDVQGFGNGCN